MKNIRIAFCLRDMQMGGVESVLIRTLDALQKYKNIEISFITYVDIKNTFYKQYFSEHANIKCYSLYPSNIFGTDLPHFFLIRMFIHLMRGIYRGIHRKCFIKNILNQFDVFIDYHDFGFIDELKKIKCAKKIAWFHSSLNVFIKRRFEKYMKHYDKCVVLTDECMRALQGLYPQYQDKIIRIYNPIDIKDIQNKAKEKININGDYFCSVSRLSGDKDVKTILNGFDMFYNTNKNPNVKLIIVGDGDKANEYKKYANILKSKKQIMFMGAQQNPFVYMKNALANILSSYGEGLPTVLVESMALNSLNISSDCKCGPREILLDGHGGLLFKPGNANQLAQLLTDVYNGNVDTKSMIKEATKSLNRFDSDEIAKQIISLIF